MKIVGKVPDTYILEPFLTSLQGVEKRCASCKKRWEDDEKVVVFITSTVKDDKIALADDSIHIVHLSPCLEEFVGTIMASFPKPESLPQTQPKDSSSVPTTLPAEQPE